MKAGQVLASIEGSSRKAVVELHRLLGFLRQEGDPDDLGSQPGLGSVRGPGRTSGAEMKLVRGPEPDP